MYLYLDWDTNITMMKKKTNDEAQVIDFYILATSLHGTSLVRVNYSKLLKRNLCRPHP